MLSHKARYGLRALLRAKEAEKASLDQEPSSDEIIRDREELAEQLRALKELGEMAKQYGYDVSEPARNAREAVQWLYFGYLAAVKEQNGAAMSLGRTSTFLDIYFERDLAEGTLNESQAQEIVDALNQSIGDPSMSKYRTVLERHKRTIHDTLFGDKQLYELANALEACLKDKGDGSDSEKSGLAEFWGLSENQKMRALPVPSFPGGGPLMKAMTSTCLDAATS